MTFGTTVLVTLTPIECCNCGCHFGMDEVMRQRKMNDHGTFYCPNGHPQSYTGENEAERLKREAKKLKDDLWHAEWLAENAKRRAAATKGQFTKYRNRVANGICPCCNNTFPDVAAHMASQHPGEVANQDTPYIEPDKETEKAEPSTQTGVRFKTGDKIIWRDRAGTFLRYSKNKNQVVVLVEGYSSAAYKPIEEVLKAADKAEK